MTRIVCISDTHNRHKEVKLPEGDILVHAGDFTGRGLPKEIVKFGRWLSSLEQYKHKIVIAGNHEKLFESNFLTAWSYLNDSAAPNVHYLQDRQLEIDGIKFYGSPWQPAFCNWAFNLERSSDTLKEKWDAIPDDTNVLITHGPPKYILDKADDGYDCGCEHLAARTKELEHLKLHVFGHIHESAGQVWMAGVTYVNASFLDRDWET